MRNGTTEMASVAETIREKLEAGLAPVRIEIVDQSARHAGHAGARPEGETHFHVVVVAAAFAGKTRLQRHRLVNDLLAAELRARVHALGLTLLAPDETPSV